MGCYPKQADQGRLNAAYDGNWVNLVPINGWTVGAIQPQIMRDSRNVVHCRGRIISPGGNSAAILIPVGFRPPSQGQYFDAYNGGTDVANPSTTGTLDILGNLAMGLTSAGAVDAVAARVCSLDRLVWSAV